MAHMGLGWTYVVAGAPELALGPLDEALELMGDDSTDSYLVLYMRAVAYRDLGRHPEAIAAARASVAARANSPASRILRDLGAQPAT